MQRRLCHIRDMSHDLIVPAHALGQDRGSRHVLCASSSAAKSIMRSGEAIPSKPPSECTIANSGDADKVEAPGVQVTGALPPFPTPTKPTIPHPIIRIGTEAGRPLQGSTLVTPTMSR
jgi:hypothetical protein